MTDPTALPRPTTAPAGRPFQVLILMSRTGGGHLASARALEAELLRQRPDCKVTIVDMLTDHLAFPFSPSDVQAGTVFEFALYHLMPVDQTTLFPFHMESVG